MSSPASRSVTAASGQLQQRQVSTIQDQSEHRKRTLEDIGRNNHIDNNNNNNNISISKQDRETNLNEMIDQEQEQGSGTPSKNHKQFVEKKRQDSPDSACGSTSTTVYLDDSGNGRASKTGSCGSETNDDGYNKSRPAAAATTVTFQEDQTEANDRSNVRQNGHNKNSTGGHGAGGDIGGGKSICNKPARLLHEIREPLKLKNFSEEIRGAMDVEQSVCQSELLLDCRESSIEGIVGAMLLRAVENEPKRKGNNYDLRRVAEQVAREIFVPGSSMLMAQTIQGVEQEPLVAGQDLEADQSWLCALCQSAQFKRRHMTIARFRDPVNMGVNAHEVRLFVLILTPVETKGTKGALETGRTFATLLASAPFRSKLLAARDETEFKTLLVLEAQQLRESYQESDGNGNGSGSVARVASELPRFKNRHKYLFDTALHMSISQLTSSSSKSQLRGMVDDNNNNPASQSVSSYDISSGAGDSSPVVTFNKNPRTNQLFELIICDSSAAAAADKKQNGANGSLNFNANNKESNSNFSNNDKSTKDKTSGRKKSLCSRIEFGKGLWEDLCRRIRFYPSDFLDGFIGPPRTLQKTLATTWFLYFGILLPTIAFSSLNTHQTHGHMGDLRKAIIGQAIGGLCFALFGGQPLVIIMTTAPLCLYTKVIHQMCIDYGFHFPAMYAAVGIWNGVFLTIYSLFGFSKLMRWCTRSTEEIFALFIVIAFITDAGKDLAKNFHKNYYSEACQKLDWMQANNMTIATDTPTSDPNSVCRRESSLLFTLLMLGTLWLSTSLYRFNKTPYLSPGKRQLLADYALPTAVIIMSFFGSYVFSEIYVEKFPPVQELRFERAQVELLTLSGMLVSLGLGFTLSLLFFMDQNISAAMVNAPQNKLKKGCAYHYDLLVVGVLNGFLASFGLPMMHGVLPHSPLHVLSLSDIEERFEEGHLKQVVTNCRETRVTSIVAHLLLAASLLLIPYPIAYIPRAVLNGLFLFMAVSSLDGLQIFERILLFITEQNKYPPNHYIRRCPQRKIHLFTGIQLIQLLVMCLFGFSPINVVEMFFPVIILLMIPFRHKIVPKYVGKRYLEALDGKH